MNVVYEETPPSMRTRDPISARLVFGLIVLTLGVLWTLDNLGVVDASHFVRWWPAVALGWGLARLTGIGLPQRTTPGVIWTLIGGITLLHTTGVWGWSVFDLWPVFFIVVGAVIVSRAVRGGSPRWAGAEGTARINVLAMLGAADRKVTAQDFRGGEVSAMMGAAVVDMRGAQLAENRAVLDVFAMWGGMELIVPPEWRVMGEVTAVLGGFVDRTIPPADPAAPLLVVRGFVAMGGVEIKHTRNERAWHVTEFEAAPGGQASGARVTGGGVVIRSRRGDTVKEVHVSPGGIVIRKAPVTPEDASTGPQAPGKPGAAGAAPAGPATTPPTPPPPPDPVEPR